MLHASVLAREYRYIPRYLDNQVTFLKSRNISALFWWAVWPCLDMHDLVLCSMLGKVSRSPREKWDGKNNNPVLRIWRYLSSGFGCNVLHFAYARRSLMISWGKICINAWRYLVVKQMLYASRFISFYEQILGFRNMICRGLCWSRTWLCTTGSPRTGADRRRDPRNAINSI